MIRDLRPDDLARVLEINQANVPEVGSVDAARLAWIAGMSPIALVAEAAVGRTAGAEASGEPGDGPTEVVAFCLVLGGDAAYDSVNYRWFVERFDDFMYLDRVAVDATARGRGLGRALYDEVDRRMRELGGAEQLALEVNVDPPNEPSLAFHARLGFVEVGQQDTPYGIRVSMQSRPVHRS